MLLARPTDPPRGWQPAVDPVCGRPVEPVPIAYHLSHKDQDYYFCSMRCEERFKADPELYSQRAMLGH